MRTPRCDRQHLQPPWGVQHMETYTCITHPPSASPEMPPTIRSPPDKQRHSPLAPFFTS